MSHHRVCYDHHFCDDISFCVYCGTGTRKLGTFEFHKEITFIGNFRSLTL